LYDAVKASRVASPVGRDSGGRAMSGMTSSRQMAERGVTRLGRTGLRYQGLALAVLRVGYVGLCRVSSILLGKGRRDKWNFLQQPYTTLHTLHAAARRTRQMMRMSVEAKVVRRSGSASQRILARKVDSGSWSSAKSSTSRPIVAPRQRVVAGRDGPQRRPNEDMPAPPRILIGRFL